MVGVLFSGGVDSLVHLRWAQRKFGRDGVLPLYYDVGQVYAPREIPRALELSRALGVECLVVRAPRMAEDWDTAQIEFRNLFLILWTALRTENLEGVVFGMLQGESPADKTPRFVRGLQRIVDDSRRATVYGDAHPFRILTPFARSTKAEMVRWYISRFGTALLDRSVGCFQAEEPMCGKCWSCFNRWLAWEENELPLETYAVHPAAALLDRLRETVRSGGRRERRNVGKLWARRRWLREAYRCVDRYALETRGRHGLPLVLGWR